MQDFGNGLLGYLSRNPRWDPDSRELVRIEWTAEPAEQPEAPRRLSLALVPLVAAALAQLAG